MNSSVDEFGGSHIYKISPIKNLSEIVRNPQPSQKINMYHVNITCPITLQVCRHLSLNFKDLLFSSLPV